MIIKCLSNKNFLFKLAIVHFLSHNIYPIGTHAHNHLLFFSLFLIEVFLLLVSFRIIDKIMQFTNALLHRVLFCMVSSGDCYMIFRVILGRRKKVINSFVFIVLLWIFCTVDFHFFLWSPIFQICVFITHRQSID